MTTRTDGGETKELRGYAVSVVLLVLSVLVGAMITTTNARLDRIEARLREAELMVARREERDVEIFRRLDRIEAGVDALQEHMRDTPLGADQ